MNTITGLTIREHTQDGPLDRKTTYTHKGCKVVTAKKYDHDGELVGTHIILEGPKESE